MKSRRIYKSLISIIIISMLTMSGIAVASARSPGPTPTPTSTVEAVQNQRLTNLEANDTNQSINNTEQQGLIVSLDNTIKGFADQINQLFNRVTNLENDPYPAVYLNTQGDLPICYQGDCGKDVINVSFYLPENSYVFVSSSGRFPNPYPNPISMCIDVTGDGQVESVPRGVCEGFNASYGSFSISNMYKLDKGNYTAHLTGNTVDDAWISELNIGAITIRKGSLGP